MSATHWIKITLYEGSVPLRDFQSPSLEHDAAFVTFGATQRGLMDFIRDAFPGQAIDQGVLLSDRQVAEIAEALTAQADAAYCDCHRPLQDTAEVLSPPAPPEGNAQAPGKGGQ